MKNFHYRDQLLNQLQETDKEIQRKKKELERKQLQAEFYEDSHKYVLADQIMNQLLKKSPQNQALYPTKDKYFQPEQPNNGKKNLKNLDQNRQEYKVLQHFQNQNKNFHNQYQISPKVLNSPRKNNFVNQREIQKQKLQNQNEGFFPFEQNKEQSRGRKIPLSPSKMFNPFVQDEDIRQKQQQQLLRKHREELQKQLQQDRKRKKIQKNEDRQRKAYLGDFNPSQYDSHKKKKIDPNAPASVLTAKMIQLQNARPAANQRNKSPDLISRTKQTAFIKAKIEDAKNKYRKGLINADEKESIITKIQNFYGIKSQDLQRIISSKNYQPQKQFKQDQKVLAEEYKNESKVHKEQFYQQKQKQQQISPKKYSSNLYLDNKQNSLNYQMKPDEYTQHPQYQMPPPIYPYMYPPFNHPSLYNSGLMNNENTELMKRMFQQLKEMRQMYKGSLDKQLLNETMAKMANVTDMLAHQIQSSYKSKPTAFDSNRSISLLAVANKIPFSPKKQTLIKNSRLQSEKFYKKPYKVREFKNFDVLVDVGRENNQIPFSVKLSYAKNAQEMLKQNYQFDLLELKNYQKKREINKIKQKMAEENKQSLLLNSRNRSQNMLQIQKKSSNNHEKIFNYQKQILKDSPKKQFLNTNKKQEVIEKQIKQIYRPSSNKNRKLKEEQNYILEYADYKKQEVIKQQQAKVPQYIREYEQKINLKQVIDQNNKKLKRYEQNKQPAFILAQQISPVRKNIHQQESLVTIQSLSQKNTSDRNNYYQAPNVNQYTASYSNQYSQPQQHNSKEFYGSNALNALAHQTINTVESVDESQTKNPSFRKRSTSKKKQSSISKSKFHESNKYSQKKQSALKQEIKKFNTMKENDSLPTVEIDQQIYESKYDESVNAFKKQKQPATTQYKHWQSLEQARKAARQGRNKQMEESYRQVQNKISQLQSFKREQFGKRKNNQTPIGKQFENEMKKEEDSENERETYEMNKQTSQIEKTPSRIMKMLQQLQEEPQQNSQYPADFHSYKEQSERMN